MDLGEILRVMRSRWYIVAPMLLLAVGLGVGAYIAVPAQYSTYTMVSLLSSESATTTALKGQDNPFLNFSDSLTATADFLGRRLQSTDVVQQLRREGVTEKYTVALAENAQGPFLTLTVTGTDQDHIVDSAATLARYADTVLIQIQQQNGVASKDMIRLTQLIPPQKPQSQSKKKLELVIAASGGTVALTFLITFVVESVARSRRRAALGAADPAPAGDGGTPQPQPAVGSVSARRSSTVVRSNADVGAQTKVLKMPAETTPSVRPQPGIPRTDSASAERTAIITMPLRADRSRPPEPSPPLPRQPGPPAGDNGSRGKAPVPPANPAPRATPSTTYQSKSADHRGQDVNRVNGS